MKKAEKGKSRKNDKSSLKLKMRNGSRLSHAAVFLLGAAAGIIAGVFIAPAKGGFGCNSGNTTYNYYGTKPDDFVCTSEELAEARSEDPGEQE